jgi:4'-phosphopantetheinyl transferase
VEPPPLAVHWLAWDRAGDAPLPCGLVRLLDADDLARRDAYRPDFKRREHVVGRALLRIALAEATGSSPEELRFRYGERGRPELEHPASPDLSFNLSHCPGLVACAVARGVTVGLDVERASQRRYFHPSESAWVQAGDRDTRLAAVWVLKEAIIKALGDGLSIPLTSFTVVDPVHGPLDRATVPGRGWLGLRLHWPSAAHAMGLATRDTPCPSPELRPRTIDALHRAAPGL